jgi:protoporphyrinogen oxidase
VQSGSRYDTVIIGGGIAGLVTAFDLRDRNIVLLEKSDRLGGRVWTKTAGDARFEVGALFGYADCLAPPGFEGSPLLSEDGPLGFSKGGRLFLGNDVADALKGYVANPSELQRVRLLFEILPGREALAALPNDTRAIVEAFFNVIHPGPMERYVPERFGDAFVRFDVRHYSAGNGGLVSAYERLLENRVVRGAETLSVELQNDGVVVRSRHEGSDSVLRARTAVIATTATAARKILRAPQPTAGRFLESVSYGAGTVVTIGTGKRGLPAFNYVVTPDRSFNTVFQSATAAADVTILTVYYVDGHGAPTERMAPDRIVRQTIDELAVAGIGPLAPDDLLFADVVEWKELGTVISAETYDRFTPDALEPLHGVFLAGDYTFWNRTRMPYGMASAAESGRRAARLVAERLEPR